MRQKLLALALLSMGIGLSGMSHADLAGGLAAYKAGRYDEAPCSHGAWRWTARWPR